VHINNLIHTLINQLFTTNCVEPVCEWKAKHWT